MYQHDIMTYCHCRPFFLVVFHLIYWSSYECSLQDIINQQQSSVPATVLQGLTSHRCGSLDFTTRRLLCQVLSEEDEKKLLCQGEPSCEAPVSHCSDGSLNKTCFPVADTSSLHYQCVCHSDPPPITASLWGYWEQSNEPQNQFNFIRKLHVITQSACFGEKATTSYNIVSELKLSDSVYSASSVFLSGVYEAYRARLDNYFTNYCVWAARDYIAPWLKISLPTAYSVDGVTIWKRCESSYSDQYPTTISVESSADDISWQDVVWNSSTSFDLIYDNQGVSTVWFPWSYIKRFWKINILSYSAHPSMKCDLIGTFSSCVLKEYAKLNHIIADYNLPDSVLTSSTFHSSSYEPFRARIDNYFTYGCAWASGIGDATPWLKIRLPVIYTVEGITIRKRCDFPSNVQFPKIITIERSDDDSMWHNVIEDMDITELYSPLGSASVLFSQAYDTLFWKVYILTHNVYPAMKCDLLGHEIP